MKKLLFLSIVFLLSLDSFATFEYDGIYYAELSDTTVKVVANPEGAFYSGNIVIPTEVERNNQKYRVVAIGDSAFADCVDLTSIQTKASVASVGRLAFIRAKSLVSADMPEVVSIGSSAFYECEKLVYASLPKVTNIPYGLFCYCKQLTSVNMPNVSTIGEGAFYGCTLLGSFDFSNATSVGDKAFLQCKSLVSADMQNVVTIGEYAFYECVALATVKMPNVVALDSLAFGYCEKLETIEMSNVLTIGYCALKNCTKLKEVSMPNVKKVDMGAFYYCRSLVVVDMPNVESLDSLAFRFCDKLETMNVPNIGRVGYGAFADCESLTTIDLPKVSFIGYHAFENCKNLTSVELSMNVDSIEDGVFSYCNNLSYVRIKNTTPPVLGLSVFHNTPSNMVIYIPQGTKDKYKKAWGIGYNYEEDVYVFEYNGIWYSKLTSKRVEVVANPNGSKYTGDITISSTCKYDDTTYDVVAIGDSAFYGCSGLTSIKLKSKTTAIGKHAFANCSSLGTVEIGNVRTIGERAFYACNALKEVDLISATTLGVGAFYDCNKLEIVRMPYGVTVEDYAFYHCDALNEVDIPNVRTIGNSVFAHCGQLKRMYVSNTKTIGEKAFYKCKSLKEMELYSVAMIGESAFGYCDSLNRVVSPMLMNVGKMAFYNCEALCEIDLSNIYMIDEFAFYGANLDSLDLPVSLDSIGDAAFSANYNLRSIKVDEYNQKFASQDDVLYNKDYTSLLLCPMGKGVEIFSVPFSVTEIGDYAFYYCRTLTSIDMPTVVTVGEMAFYDCHGLTSVAMGTSVDSIKENAFMHCQNLEAFIISTNTPPVLGHGAFYAVPTDMYVQVPCAALEQYRAAEGWKEFSWYEGVMMYQVFAWADSDTMGYVTINNIPSCENPIAEIEAVALDGYEFDSWDDGDRENPRMVSMEGATADVYLKAIFKKIDIDTDIDDVDDEEFGVYVDGATICVDGVESEYYVYTASGLLIYAGTESNVVLPRGIYVVYYNGTAKKIVL